MSSQLPSPSPPKAQGKSDNQTQSQAQPGARHEAAQQSYRLSDFYYHLPPELVAQHPLADRSASRLLHLPRDGGWADRQFSELADLLFPGDLLVFNNSKVIPARLRLEKASGGAVEILVERILTPHRAVVMMKANRKPEAGARLLKAQTREDIGIELLGRDPSHDDRFQIQTDAPLLEVLNAHGQLPLPPYITHSPNEDDQRRYQTVYASNPGSVAAPTAGLHFDEAILAALRDRGVETTELTLHVGSGTFAPVKSENLAEHRMHSEWCELPAATASAIAKARARGGRIVAVGTTSLRTLESAYARQRSADKSPPIGGALAGDSPLSNDPLSADSPNTSRLRPDQWETDLFITPGYKFGLVDMLVTNFHLPQSTLLMLVSAFAGYERIRSAYAHAIDNRYRFFSYGDAMLLERAEANSDRQASNR